MCAPLPGNPRAGAHICLVFSNHSFPPSLCLSPSSSTQSRSAFPHFSLEWVSYPRLCSGLSLLNTNKTHSTQVEQGARGWLDKWLTRPWLSGAVNRPSC